MYFFFKGFIFIISNYVWICLPVDMYMRVQVPKEPRGVRSPGAGVIDDLKQRDSQKSEW